MAAAKDFEHNFAYTFNSSFQNDQLKLAASTGTIEFPYFYDAQMKYPERTAKQLLTVGRLAGTRFYTPPAMVAKMIREADPVVTAGAGKLRFESFSSCCGSYCRLDLLEEALQTSFNGRGTTNVDFNRPMRDTLTRINKRDKVKLTVSQKQLEVKKNDNESVIEHQVKLPMRWYKGFVEVQSYASTLKLATEIKGPVARRFLQSLNAQVSAKSEVHLIPGPAGIRIARRPSRNSIHTGGIERLKFMAHLANDIKSLNIYSSDSNSITGYELVNEESRFLMIISPYACRGFSGEGQALESLAHKLDEFLIDDVRSKIKFHAQISTYKLLSELEIDKADLITSLSALGSRGLIGFDVHEQEWFYRELPYNPGELYKIHPRLKSARKLIESKAVSILHLAGREIHEAHVKSAGTTYRILKEGLDYKCNCDWYVKTLGKQGPCKHVLAVLGLSR